MLPGLGFSEIVLVGLLTLLVVQPKDLPALMRTLGRWTRKLQAMAAEFRAGFDELARQTELDELRREVETLRRTANPFSEFRQHVEDLRADVMRPIEPPGPQPAPGPEAAPNAGEIAPPDPAPPDRAPPDPAHERTG